MFVACIHALDACLTKTLSKTLQLLNLPVANHVRIRRHRKLCLADHMLMTAMLCELARKEIALSTSR